MSTKNIIGLNADALEGIEYLRESLNKDSELRAKWIKALEPESYNVWHDFMQKHIQEHREIMRKQQEEFSKLGKQIEEWQNYLRGDFLNALIGNKWFITPTFELQTLNEAAANFKVNTTGEQNKSESEILEEYFVTKFSKKKYKLFGDLISEWENKYKIIDSSRLRIIKNCFEVLKTQKIEVSLDVIIPTLIAQVEGIAKDFGWKKEKCFLDSKSKNGAGKALKDTFSDKLKSDKDSIFYMFFVPAEAFLNEVLYANKPKISENINRHNILHGDITNYGSLANLIRIFLAIDLLCCIKIYVKDSSI